MVRARRGQAELIAATIAIAVFVLVVVFMILSVTATGYVSTSALAERARFENERQLEKLTYTYDPSNGICVLMNAGSVDIKIVRIWRPDGTVDTSSNLVNRVISPGQSLPIADWGSVAYIVTARGNVFPVQSRCQELKELSQSGGASGGLSGVPPLSSSNFVTNDREFVAPNKKGGIICRIKGDNSLIDCFVLYNYSNAWIVNNGAGWIVDPSSSVFISDSDISGDGVNEFIAATIKEGKYEEVDLSNYDKIEWNLTFVNITRIDSSTDVIYVYFEYVIQLNQQSESPHPLLLSISVILSNGSASIEFPASYASYVGSRGGNTVMVVQGSATIPRNAYQNLANSFTDGIYNLTLKLYIDHPQQGKGQGQVHAKVIRLQALAISGAKIVWRESVYQG